MVLLATAAAAAAAAGVARGSGGFSFWQGRTGCRLTRKWEGKKEV